MIFIVRLRPLPQTDPDYEIEILEIQALELRLSKATEAGVVAHLNASLQKGRKVKGSRSFPTFMARGIFNRPSEIAGLYAYHPFLHLFVIPR